MLSRPRLRRLFQRAGVDVAEFLADFPELVEIIEPNPTNTPVRDETDRIFLDLVATGPPVEFLITGDRDSERTQDADVPVISGAGVVKTNLSQRILPMKHCVIARPDPDHALTPIMLPTSLQWGGPG